MEAIEWDPALETGDELVDEQHRAIHALFNELAVASDSPRQIMHTLDRLMDHVALHFGTEEELMRREEYPEELATAHIAGHRELTEGAREKVLEFRSGALTGTGPLLEFLRDWVVSHVDEHDRHLIEYVRARNGAARLPES